MVDKIIKQYKESQGISNLSVRDLNNPNIRLDLLQWLLDRSVCNKQYATFLYMLNNDITLSTTAEVGKSQVDSISLPYNTTIISPYKFENIDNPERLIEGKMIIGAELPYIYNIKDDKQIITEFPRNRINTIITHNPYAPINIQNWEKMHNKGSLNIGVGVFGYVSDKDKLEKMKLLEDLRDKIIGSDYRFEFDTFNDIYCAAIMSESKVKKLSR